MMMVMIDVAASLLAAIIDNVPWVASQLAVMLMIVVGMSPNDIMMASGPNQ